MKTLDTCPRCYTSITPELECVNSRLCAICYLAVIRGVPREVIVQERAAFQREALEHEPVKP